MGCPVGSISIDRINGQYLPVIDDNKCVKCNKCETVCVAINGKNLAGYETLKSYYGFSKDDSTRKKSSSGGIFFEIAQHFIKDGGVVVGAAYDDTFTVRHRIVTSADELAYIRGSKYVESDLHGVLEETLKLLKSGRKVLFSGVPCQIGAIKTFIGKPYSNLYCCEVFCHGAPRSGIFISYTDYLQRKYGTMKAFNFRSKHFGWENPAYEIELENKKIIQQHKDNVYHLMFGNHVSLRDSCYECQFRQYRRFADLSLGDFWGIYKYYPEADTKEGVSAINVNTAKGQELLDGINLYLEPCKLEEIYDLNKWMIMNFEKPSDQSSFIDDYRKMSTDTFMNKYEIKYKITDKIKRVIRRVIK